MTNQTTPSPEETPGLGWPATLLISLLLLAVAGGGSWLIFSSEPTATREGAAKRTAMLVNVTGVEQGSFRPEIRATGAVRAARETVLAPRVNGQVVELAPAFEPGGFVETGETLVRLEATDFENALAQRRAELDQAIADRAIEMGQQAVAQQEFELIDQPLSPERKALVLRQPQLRQAEARVAAARAAVDQAEADLARTRIRAPFHAQVVEREVNLGSQVLPGDGLARLVGVETYWVEATVPVARLRWLSLAEDDGPGSVVSVRQRAWAEGEMRDGRLLRLIGELEGSTRLARVLVGVDDPLALDTDGPPLLLGAFVDTRMQGRPIEDVIRLDRDLVRKNDTVWVMQEGKLHIAEVDIVLQDARYAYIRDGLAPDARVVTTNLATVTEGAPLRLADEPQAAGGGEAP